MQQRTDKIKVTKPLPPTINGIFDVVSPVLGFATDCVVGVLVVGADVCCVVGAVVPLPKIPPKTSPVVVVCVVFTPSTGGVVTVVVAGAPVPPVDEAPIGAAVV